MGIIRPILPSDLGFSPSKFPSYRNNQYDLALTIAHNPKRFDLLAAKTGSGKSLLYTTAGRLRQRRNINSLTRSRTLVLTVNKPLQSQLGADFSSAGMIDIRGHSNYPCARMTTSRHTGDDEMECSGRSRGGLCHYDRRVEELQDHDLVSTNVANWIHIAKMGDPDRFGSFDTLVIDEAHFVAPSSLCDYLAVEIPRNVSQFVGSSPPSYASHEELLRWAKRSLSNLSNLSGAVIRKSPSIRRSLERYVSMCELSPGTQWVVAYDSAGNIKSTPVWCAPFTEQYLFRGIPKVILSSATMSPATSKYFGIPQSNSTYHEVPSQFPVRNRPVIYISNSPQMRKDSPESDYRKWARTIDQIITKWIDYKGVIHSQSYDRALDIQSRSKHAAHMILHRAGANSHMREQTIQQFKESNPPSILVSPVIREGVDFPDDYCRYGIIPKLPFVNSKEPLTNARFQSDLSYRDHCIAAEIEQEAGRYVRNTTDWGVTFINDGQWNWFRKNKSLFSQSFQDSWQELGVIPSAADLGLE